jgi:vacuole morphology and inheritance protein 14
MRSLLRNLKYEAEEKEENFKFFETIYTAFCYNQVSTITLSLLAEEYELTYHLVLCL